LRFDFKNNCENQIVQDLKSQLKLVSKLFKKTREHHLKGHQNQFSFLKMYFTFLGSLKRLKSVFKTQKIEP
jgi:hypothetical protein